MIIQRSLYILFAAVNTSQVVLTWLDLNDIRLYSSNQKVQNHRVFYSFLAISLSIYHRKKILPIFSTLTDPT